MPVWIVYLLSFCSLGIFTRGRTTLVRRLRMEEGRFEHPEPQMAPVSLAL
jgi:hypothetical protein